MMEIYKYFDDNDEVEEVNRKISIKVTFETVIDVVVKQIPGDACE